MRIEYIGIKDVKRDNVAGTDLVWNGAGDIHDVPDLAALALLRHPSVWRVAQETPAGPEQEAEQGAEQGAGPPLNAVPQDPAAPVPGETVTDLAASLAKMSDQEIRDLARRFDLPVDLRLRGHKLREAVAKAAAEA